MAKHDIDLMSQPDFTTVAFSQPGLTDEMESLGQVNDVRSNCVS
jgi:hypothetical protein